MTADISSVRRSGAVRQATRAHLMALRAARRDARRLKSTAAPQDMSGPIDPPCPDAPSQDAFDDATIAVTPQSEAQAEPPSTEDIPPQEEPFDGADLPETTALDPEPTPPMEEEVAPDPTLEPSIDETSPPLSDLLKLPGAGLGLVRLLNNAGIETLDDLAATNPEDLAAKLGFIGELLDLPYWIHCAQNKD